LPENGTSVFSHFHSPNDLAYHKVNGGHTDYVRCAKLHPGNT